MDRFQEILWDLGELTEMPLHVDKNRACKLLLEGSISLQIEMDDTKDRLLIAGIITEIPAGKFRENVLKEALKVNSTYHPFGVFSYVEKINSLILFNELIASEITPEKLLDFLESFIEEAHSWRLAIHSGQAAPIKYLSVKREPIP